MYEFKRDPLDLFDTHNKTISSQGYANEEGQSAIINIVVASGAKQYLNIDVGQDSLKLCQIGTNDCFKARVVLLADKFPGFEIFSSFLSIVYIKPTAILSQG